jgi:predicted adenine nucleotide alpha hydrolase (AANH) superfamily ATPase
MIKKIKNKIKSILFKTPKLGPYFYWNEKELRQKRICEKWSISMLADYYEVNEYSMREVLDFYEIK